MDDLTRAANRDYRHRTQGVIASLEASGRLSPWVGEYMSHGEEGLAVMALLADLKDHEDMRGLLTSDDCAFLLWARANLIASGLAVAEGDFLNGP